MNRGPNPSFSMSGRIGRGLERLGKFARPLAVVFIAVPVLASLPAEADAADLSDSVLEQIQTLVAEKTARTPAQQKIDSQLLYAEKIARGQPVAPGIPQLRSSVKVDPKGNTVLDIDANVTPELLALIDQLGGQIIHSSAQFRSVRALMPLGAVQTLTESPDVQFIAPETPAGTRKIDTSEGDVAHQADVARASFAVDGSGVGVGVLSDGVSSLAAIQASGDLPLVTVLPGQTGSGDEGTAMLEIVYDLAPGADLYFATGLGGVASFAQNILDLAAAGCDVIVDDVFYANEGSFQDDVIAQAVNTVTAAGVQYFSSAGNAGNLNDGTSGVWEGDFVNGGAAGGPIAGAGTLHDFGAGDTANRVTVDTPFWFTLQWSDPLNGSANDYDLYLLNSTGTTVLAASTNAQTGSQDPFELIDSGPFNDTNTLLVVVQASGAARFVRLNTHRGRLQFNTSGQTDGHSAAANAFSVAAVDVATAGGGAFTGGTTNPLETYSSDGLRRMFYTSGGTPYTPGNFSSTGGLVRNKPDIAAADCVSTASPGFSTFCGTSAAAPHAAAIAALLLDAAPLANVRSVLTGTALDIEASGYDRDSGYGITMGTGVGDVRQPPRVTGIWTSAPVVIGQTVSLFVFGDYFGLAPGATQVFINEIEQLIVQPVTPEMLIVRVTVTGAMIGGPVTVTTPEGSANSTTNFGTPLTGVNITGIWPASASVGKFVFVFGSGYAFPMSVTIGATPVPLVQVVSPDMFIMIVPSGATTGPVSVTTPSGSTTSTEDLIIVP